MSRYTPQTILNYNASPPPDDGSQTAANQSEWAKHKDKLGDPLKNLAESINTELSAMDGRIYPNGVTTTATSLTLTKAAHDGKNVRASGASTITLPEAATATATFHVIITKTDASNTLTVDTQSSETIDGAASVTLTSLGEAIGLVTDGSAWFIDARYFADQPLPLDYISGFVITLNGSDTDHDIDIAVGEARDADNSVNIALTAAITKQINAVWAEGTNQGGFPSGLSGGVVQADTTYRIFDIVDDAGNVDAGFDTSSTAVNLLADATDYIGYREIGQFSTDSAANIAQIWQREGVAGTASSIATTSGTAHTFLGVPSWVTEMTFVGIGVSMDGTDEPQIQIGDSGGLETSGYDGHYERASNANANSSGWVLGESLTAAGVTSFSATVKLADSGNNRWSIQAVFAQTDQSGGGVNAGTKSLTGALDRITILPTGSDNFDAGAIYLSYR